MAKRKPKSPASSASPVSESQPSPNATTAQETLVGTGLSDSFDESDAVDEQAWAPAPPPPTPSWDALFAQAQALRVGAQETSRANSSEWSDSFSALQGQDDPFFSSEVLSEVALDSPFASLEKGLPDIPHFDEFGRCAATERQFRPLLRFLVERYFRVKVEGIENVPARGRAILVANHAGVLPYDALVLMRILDGAHSSPRALRPLIEDMFFHAPVLGPWLERLGCVRANRENARRLLEREHPIVVFPEGYKGLHKSFSERYRLQRFGRGGFVKLALRSRAPLIPVAILGSEEAHPMLGKFSWLTKSFGFPFFPVTPTFPFLGPLGLLPLPVPWVIRFGAPIQFDCEAEQANDPLLLNRLVEEVRQQVQLMVTQLVVEHR